MKNFKWYWMAGLMVVFFVLCWAWIQKRKGVEWDGSNDLRIAVISDDYLKLVSISPDRRMLNQLKINGAVSVWIPEGYGWYMADRLKKLLVAEKKEGLAKKIFFYNFGFWPEKVIWLAEGQEWQSEKVLFGELGWDTYFKYKYRLGALIEKEEEVKKEIKAENIGEILQRDFSDNRLSQEDIRLSLVNRSESNGLASWLSQRMEWEGFTVMSLGTEDEGDDCSINYEEGLADSLTLERIKQLFDCKVEAGVYLNEGEIELSLGKKMASMIKYESYNSQQED